MQEHPIPQDVTGYKFHIVGNMTLKQFAEVAVGVIVALIIYNTNLLFFIKWPLIVLAVGLGGMMAFVPIEERPLDHWIVTFFKRLYSPTKFYWRKDPDVPFAMTEEKQVQTTEEAPVEVDLTPARQQRIKDYLASVNQPKPANELDQAEQSKVSSIIQTFDDVSVKNVQSNPQIVKPQLTPRVRVLPAAQPPAKKQTVFQSPPKTDSTLTASVDTGINNTQVQPPAQVQLAQIPITNLGNDQPANEQASSQAAQPEEIAQPAEQSVPLPTSKASTNTTLPFPQKSQQPNTLMGMVLTPDNKLVDRAVVTIKNTQGKAIRALKTNLLGQFFGTAPLPNGSYILSVEKPGLSFPDQTLQLNGSIVEPIELRAG